MVDLFLSRFTLHMITSWPSIKHHPDFWHRIFSFFFSHSLYSNQGLEKLGGVPQEEEVAIAVLWQQGCATALEMLFELYSLQWVRLVRVLDYSVGTALWDST